MTEVTDFISLFRLLFKSLLNPKSGFISLPINLPITYWFYNTLLFWTSKSQKVYGAQTFFSVENLLINFSTSIGVPKIFKVGPLLNKLYWLAEKRIDGFIVLCSKNVTL